MDGLPRDSLLVDDLALVVTAPVAAATRGGDWPTLHGMDDLLQALWLRLVTPEGAVAALGHPEYGSRLHLLVGELDTPAVRDRARLYTTQALHRDSRVQDIIAVHVESVPASSGRQLDIRVRVRASGNEQPLDFGFPVFLELT